MKELRATTETRVLISNQSYPRFVNQRSWLKRLTWKLLGHLDGRIAPQFCIQEHKEFVGGARFAALHSLPSLIIREPLAPLAIETPAEISSLFVVGRGAPLTPSRPRTVPISISPARCTVTVTATWVPLTRE